MFTSFVQMQAMADELQPWFEEQQIELFLHTKQTDREELLKGFKAREKTVLFGAESFWEGVDVPGDDLICVVIVKLPFPVPSEPLVEARCSKLEAAGEDAFVKFSVPVCVLKLKQGFGRLIRTVTDHGAVVILDSRLIRSKFGPGIIRSLPPAKLSTNLADIQKIRVPVGISER